MLVYLTCPDFESARRLARALVEERAAAGVNIVPGAVSIYRWQGEIREKNECLLLAQTSTAAYGKLESVARRLHSYAVPCILGLETSAGNADFLRWIEDNCERVWI